MALGLAIAGLLAVFSGGLLLVTQGAAVSTPSSADPAVEYTEWVNQGDPVLTHENVPPGPTTDTERWIPVGVPTKHVTVVGVPAVPPTPGYWDDTVVTFYTWNGGSSDDAPPVYSDDTRTRLHPDWNATSGNPQGGEHADAALYTPYEVGNGDHTASWFLKAGTYVPGTPGTPAVDEVSHLDHQWQKQVRTVVTPPVVTPPVVTPPEVAPAEVPPRCPEPWPLAEEPTKGPQATAPAAPEVLGEQASAPTRPTQRKQQDQVPTVVDAGYAGQPSGEGWATALLVGGMLLLASSGAVAGARRT